MEPFIQCLLAGWQESHWWSLWGPMPSAWMSGLFLHPLSVPVPCLINEVRTFYILYFTRNVTGTALSDDNGRTLVTTAPWSGGRETQLQTN